MEASGYEGIINTKEIKIGGIRSEKEQKQQIISILLIILEFFMKRKYVWYGAGAIIGIAAMLSFAGVLNAQGVIPSYSPLGQIVQTATFGVFANNESNPSAW
ncbi:MAG: hypothetical protein WCT27_05580, partial [Patescibacteria group bacterium]